MMMEESNERKERRTGQRDRDTERQRLLWLLSQLFRADVAGTKKKTFVIAKYGLNSKGTNGNKRSQMVTKINTVPKIIFFSSSDFVN